MKKVLTILFIICITLTCYAQKFQLTNLEGNLYTDGETIAVSITEEDLNTFDEYFTEFIVKNLTGEELNIRTIRTNIEIVDGMQAYVCAGIACYPDDAFEIDLILEPESSENYALHLAPKGNFGMCKFKLDFMLAEEKITIFINIDVQQLGVAELNSTISLTAFPNPVPANSTVNISFTLADKNDINRLVIRNIVGSEVMNIPLNPYQESTSIDISPLVGGIYFYAIETQNQIVIAKKLIVK